MIRMNRGLTLSMLAFGVVSAANAQIAFNNGPLETSAGVSLLQTTTVPLTGGNPGETVSLNIFGFGQQFVGSPTPTTDNRMADDIVIPAHATLNVDSVTFFGYQTGSTTTSTFTSMRLRVWNAEPTNAGTPIAGDWTTNRLTSTSFSGIFRALDTTPTNTQRPIMANRVANTGGWIPALSNGTFWFEWNSAGSLASGPWAPPVTFLGLRGKPGANGRQQTGGPAAPVWAPANDTGAPAFTTPVTQDLPFVVRGTWRLVPTSASVQSGFGQPIGGNLASLASSDNNRFLVLNDENEPEGRLLVNTSVPFSNGNAASVTFTLESASVRDDISEFLEGKDDAGAWQTLNFRTTTLADFVSTVVVNSGAGNFIRPNGDIELRVLWIPQSDLDAGDGWSESVDQLIVDVTPTN